MRIDPNSLVDKKFIGIPYKLGGKGFDGTDCIGVALLWLWEQGINYEYDDGLGPIMAHWWEKNPRRFLDAFLAQGINVRWPDIRKYDCLLLMDENGLSTLPSCMGVMVDDRHMLVSFEEEGSFVTMLSLHWKNRYFGAIRLHKVLEVMGHG